MFGFKFSFQVRYLIACKTCTLKSKCDRLFTCDVFAAGRGGCMMVIIVFKVILQNLTVFGIDMVVIFDITAVRAVAAAELNIVNHSAVLIVHFALIPCYFVFGNARMFECNALCRFFADICTACGSAAAVNSAKVKFAGVHKQVQVVDGKGNKGFKGIQRACARDLLNQFRFAEGDSVFRRKLLKLCIVAHGCGNCSNCKATYQTEDITLSAQMILSCVMRIRERLGYYVGKTLVIQVLRGSRDQRLLSLGLASLSTYGLMDKTSPSVIERYIEYLESAGYLEVDQRYSTLRPTKKASAVLFDGECVLMQKRVEPKAEKKRPRGAFSDEFEENSLYEALRAQRAELAKRESVPAYVIFSNATLADMAEKAPRSLSELLEVSGVGERKASRYGEAFLRTIEEYIQQQG